MPRESGAQSRKKANNLHCVEGENCHVWESQRAGEGEELGEDVEAVV